jgi:hypothetical protein
MELSELSELFIDHEGELLNGEFIQRSPYSNDDIYMSEIVTGVYIYPIDFIASSGGSSYKMDILEWMDFSSNEYKII